MDASHFILLAKFAATSLALVTAGYGINSSQNTLPRLYSEPARLSTSLFTHTFHAGAKFVLPASVTSMLASSYLAWALPEQREKALWAMSAGFVLSTLGWTRLVMYPGIMRLIAISEDSKLYEKAEGSREHIKLLKAWETQNYVRAGLFFAGGAVALWSGLTT